METHEATDQTGTVAAPLRSPLRLLLGSAPRGNAEATDSTLLSTVARLPQEPASNPQLNSMIMRDTCLGYVPGIRAFLRRFSDDILAYAHGFTETCPKSNPVQLDVSLQTHTTQESRVTIKAESMFYHLRRWLGPTNHQSTNKKSIYL